MREKIYFHENKNLYFVFQIICSNAFELFQVNNVNLCEYYFQNCISFKELMNNVHVDQNIMC